MSHPINTINSENYHQERQERELKNKILNMSSGERKVAKWNKYFATPVLPDDDNVY